MMSELAPEPDDQTSSPKPARGGRQRAKALEKAAWRLRERGYSYRAIGRQLGCSEAWVRKLLDRVEGRLSAEIEATALRVHARQARQLQHWLSEMARAWEGSKGEAVTIRTKVHADGTEEVTVTRLPHGDVRYASAARAVLADERELWGLGPKAKEQGSDDARYLESALRAALEGAAADGLPRPTDPVP